MAGYEASDTPETMNIFVYDDYDIKSEISLVKITNYGIYQSFEYTPTSYSYESMHYWADIESDWDNISSFGTNITAVEGSRFLISHWTYYLIAHLAFANYNGISIPGRSWYTLFITSTKPTITQRQLLPYYDDATTYLFYLEFIVDNNNNGLFRIFNTQQTNVTVTELFLNYTFSIV